MVKWSSLIRHELISEMPLWVCMTWRATTIHELFWWDARIGKSIAHILIVLWRPLRRVIHFDGAPVQLLAVHFLQGPLRLVL